MKEFEKYKLKCCKTCATDAYIDMWEVCPAMRQRKIGWKEALKWVSTFTISESIKRELDGR